MAGRAGTGLLTGVLDIDTGIEQRITSAVPEVRAIQAHASQVEGMVHVFGEDGLRQAMAVECFRLVAAKG